MQIEGFPAECPLTITDLNRRVRTHLETHFPLLWITGEISNLTSPASGHLYFSLKDSGAQVRCVVWRNKAQLLGWRPANGQRVEVRAWVTLYEPRGDFQLNIESLRRAGQGELFQRFLELKNRLEAEGLFDPKGKHPLPPYPRHIGIVTSPQAAALRDVLSTLRRRAPHIRLTLYPTPVQGEGAAGSIAAALSAAGRDGNDLIILCRGGGSIEDLWAFNEEAVARALRSLPIPVISGIGHETDFTIADFAADQRAPTPTAAAELASPERDALLARLNQLQAEMQRRLAHRLGEAGQRLDWLAGRLVHPHERLFRQRAEINRLSTRLSSAYQHLLDRKRQRFEALTPRLSLAGKSALDWPCQQLQALENSLQHLNPHAVLERGYALVYDENKRLVRQAGQLHPGQCLQITFAHGSALTTVQEPPGAAEPAPDHSPT